MSEPPLTTRTAQALRFVSSWKFAASTAFQKWSARRNPSAQGSAASILDADIPENGVSQIVVFGARRIGAGPIHSRLFLRTSRNLGTATEPHRQEAYKKSFAAAHCAARHARLYSSMIP
jgi:hypothetical protein